MFTPLINVIRLPTSGSKYFHPTLKTGEDYYCIGLASEFRMYIPAACTLENLYLNLISGTPGLGNSWTVTVRKNGSGTALAATIADSATSGNSGSNSITLAAGDYIDVQATATGTPSALDASMTLDLNTDADNTTFACFGFNLGNANEFVPVGMYADSTNITNSDDAKCIFPFDCTLTALYAWNTIGPGAGDSRTLAFSPLNTVVISGTDTTASKTGISHAITQGDLVSGNYLKTGTVTNAQVTVTALLEDTNGNALLPATYGYADDSDGSYGFASGNQDIPDYSGTDATVGPTGFKIRYLTQKCKNQASSAGIAPGDTRDVILKVNNVSSSLVATVTDISGTDYVNEVEVSPGDTISVAHDHTGTGTGAAVWYATLMAVTALPPSTGVAKGTLSLLGVGG